MTDERKEKSYPMNQFNSIYHKEFVKDMNNVFTDKENGYDFTIKCGDQVFYCHKERVLSIFESRNSFKNFMFNQANNYCVLSKTKYFPQTLNFFLLRCYCIDFALKMSPILYTCLL